MRFGFQPHILSVYFALSVSACSPYKGASDADPNSNADSVSPDLNPSAYTLSVTLQTPTGLAPNGEIDWTDTTTLQLRSSPIHRIFPLRRTVAAEERERTFSFTFTNQGATYSSDSIRFSECDLVTALGYDLDDFRHMQVFYSFDQFAAQPASEFPAVGDLDIYRVVPGSSVADAKAVTCDRVLPLPSTGQLRFVLTTSDPLESALRFSKNGSAFLPRSVTFSENPTKAKQIFEFLYPEGADAASVNEDLTVRTLQGDSKYTLRFQRCLDTYGEAQSRLVSQKIELQQDVSGKLTEGTKLECCYSSGECSAPN